MIIYITITLSSISNHIYLYLLKKNSEIKINNENMLNKICTKDNLSFLSNQFLWAV